VIDCCVYLFHCCYFVIGNWFQVFSCVYMSNFAFPLFDGPTQGQEQQGQEIQESTQRTERERVGSRAAGFESQVGEAYSEITTRDLSHMDNQALLMRLGLKDLEDMLTDDFVSVFTEQYNKDPLLKMLITARLNKIRRDVPKSGTDEWESKFLAKKRLMERGLLHKYVVNKSIFIMERFEKLPIPDGQLWEGINDILKRPVGVMLVRIKEQAQVGNLSSNAFFQYVMFCLGYSVRHLVNRHLAETGKSSSAGGENLEFVDRFLRSTYEVTNSIVVLQSKRRTLRQGHRPISNLATEWNLLQGSFDFADMKWIQLWK